MRKLFIILILLVAIPALAGEKVTTPYWIQFADTDQAERVSVEFVYNVTAPHLVNIKYKLWNEAGTEMLRTSTVQVEGSDFTALCSGICSTLQSRVNAIISQDIQDKFTTQAKP
jgi:hypothetical protein